MIEMATVSDAETLTKIALKSKSFWGYSDEILERWVEDLTVSKKIVQEMIVYKFILDDEIVGFYVLNQPQEKSIELELLFVLPNLIGKGIGNQLMQNVFQKAKQLNCHEVILFTEPNAVSFYEYKRFTISDKKETAIAGRFLTLMKKDLAE
jgi:N-acetylglutamate synthase-like GNAT family acetyltransferase